MFFTSLFLVSTLEQVTDIINKVVSISICVLLADQLVASFLSLLGNRKYKEAKKNHTYAFVICAHNEDKVVGELIKSIYAQDYPKECYKVFVIADNCTDSTKDVALENGAIVLERFNNEQIGKCYALDYGLKTIMEMYSELEAFIIFDADNLVAKDYTKEINKAYDEGFRVVTSFRNTKNFGDSFISAGSGILFFRECMFIHPSRSRFNSTYISGTGFLVDKNVILENGGWPYKTMIEDIEFSINCSIKGEKVVYAPKAEFYDEQPTTFKDTWNQRLRWCKGVHQCHFKYSFKLLKAFFTKARYSAFGLYVHCSEAPLVGFLWLIVYNLIMSIYTVANKLPFDVYFYTAGQSTIWFLADALIIALVYGILCTIKYWKHIYAPNYKKVLYCLLFPLYMFLYLPILLVAFFSKPKWKKIEHTRNITIEDINGENK